MKNKNWFEKNIPLFVNDLKDALGDSLTTVEQQITKGHRKSFRNGMIIGAALSFTAFAIAHFIF